MRAVRFAVAGTIAVAASIGAAELVTSSGHDDRPMITATLSLAAGLSFVAAGLVALWRRPHNATGRWLTAIGYLWYLAALNESNNSAVWTVGFVLGNIAIVCFGALVLAYPTGILDRRDRLIIISGGAVAVGGNLLIALLDPTPATSCSSCPDSAIAVTDAPTATSVVALVGSAIIAVLLGLIVVILVGRWRAASPTSRRILRPVYISCGITVILLLFSVATDRLANRAYSLNWLLFLLSFAVVPLTFLAGVLRTRLDRSSAAQMLVSLDAGVPLRDALAEALHDPSLEIVYWLASREEWIDELGREVPAPEATDERSVSTIERSGQRIAALIHDPVLDEEPDLVELITAGASLPLENVRLQADLRAQYLFLETVANTAPSLLVVMGTDGRILNQNRATLEASGRSFEEDIRGAFFWDIFIDADERPAMIERFAQAAPDFPPSHHENVFTDARGERRVIDWGSAPVVDATGRVTSIVAGGIDITERKQREVQLQRERDITETLMQAIPSLLVVVDSEGTIVDSGIDETIAGVNSAFRHTLGWSDDALVRRSMLDFVDPADAYTALIAIASAANGVASREQESHWLCADGGRIVVAWTATPVNDVTGRQASLVLLSGTDVTQRRRDEQEIRASRARIIEAAGEARRRLERNLHDGAQQRLVSISVSLRLAESLIATDPPAASEVIAASRAELAAALDELRELARGIHPAVLTDRGLAAAVEALALRAPLPVSFTIPSERLPTAVEAAAYYVVSEALANVVKYASASSVSVVVEELPTCVTVTVSDDGVGGADPSAGTGIRGLEDRVGALDGSLTVTSIADGGTTISAEIPLHGAAQPEIASPVDTAL